MAKRISYESSASGNPANIKLDDVTPLWLEAGPRERYLLLEDPETGDVLMPLIYMKHILEANYSRKLASLKHRLVTVPTGHPLASHEGLLYWQWAFESPHSVKVIVRKEIGEATPQGHLRLVLLPIVYNALVGRQDLRITPLFKQLHRTMRRSTYWPLLRLPAQELIDECDSEAGILGASDARDVLFQGPRSLESTAMKYMFMFKDQEEMEASKRTRTTGTHAQDNGVLSAAIRSGSAVPSPGGVAHVGSYPLLPDSGTASENADISARSGDGVPAGVIQRPVDVSANLIESMLRHSTPTGIPAAQRRDFISGETVVADAQADGSDTRPVQDRKLVDLAKEVECLKMCVLQMYNILTGVTTNQSFGGNPMMSLGSLMPPIAPTQQPHGHPIFPRQQRPGSAAPLTNSNAVQEENNVAPTPGLNVIRSTALNPHPSAPVPPTVPWPAGNLPADHPSFSIPEGINHELATFLGFQGDGALSSFVSALNRSSPQQTAANGGDPHEFSWLGKLGISPPTTSFSMQDLVSNELKRDSSSPPEPWVDRAASTVGAGANAHPKPTGVAAPAANACGADDKLTVQTPILPEEDADAENNGVRDSEVEPVYKEKAQSEEASPP